MSKFIKGMDLSTPLEMERCGAKYYDHGQEMDILDIMKKYDVDTIRLRLWNDPRSESGEPYGAGENDLAETTLAIGKRVTDAGLGVLLNFHYSDFWADPGKQIKPKAWASYGVEELEQAVYDFTKDSLQKVLDAGVNVTMIQVGNELSNGLLWPEGKSRIMIMLQSLSVREFVPCRESRCGDSAYDSSGQWRKQCTVPRVVRQFYKAGGGFRDYRTFLLSVLARITADVKRQHE